MPDDIRTPWLTGPRSKLTPAQRTARREVDELDKAVNALDIADIQRHLIRAAVAIQVAGGIGRDAVTLVAGALRRSADAMESEYETEVLERLAGTMPGSKGRP